MEPGRYKARAVSWGLGHSQKGTPQIAIELQVLEGQCEGESMTWYGSFSEAAHPYTFNSMRTLGWEGDDLGDLSTLNKNEVQITVAEEEYNGEVNLRVKWINPLGGLALKDPMKPDQIKAFAARMKGAAVASRGGSPFAGKPKNQSRGGSTARDEHAPREPAPADDDIPF